jgi:hypothetical protein
MKIAVCLSGQPRTWRQCYDTWNFLFKELKRNENLRETDIEVDYFVHTWDFNSKPYSVWTRERYGIEGFQAPPSDHQTSDEILDYIKTIQPKQFLIESEAKSLSRKDEMDKRTQFRLNTTKWCPLSWASSQLYGIMMAGHLKRQYELDNGFKYDMCVRLRPDLYFNELNRRILAVDWTPIKPKTIYSCHGYASDEMPYDAIGDIFFYSDSETYDLVSSLYNWLPQLDPFIFRDDFRIEEMLVYFARMFHIGTSKVKIDPEVRR